MVPAGFKDKLKKAKKDGRTSLSQRQKIQGFLDKYKKPGNKIDKMPERPIKKVEAGRNKIDPSRAKPMPRPPGPNRRPRPVPWRPGSDVTFRTKMRVKAKLKQMRENG